MKSEQLPFSVGVAVTVGDALASAACGVRRIDNSYQPDASQVDSVLVLSLAPCCPSGAPKGGLQLAYSSPQPWRTPNPQCCDAYH
jgi:hypothetical protein